MNISKNEFIEKYGNAKLKMHDYSNAAYTNIRRPQSFSFEGNINGISIRCYVQINDIAYLKRLQKHNLKDLNFYFAQASKQSLELNYYLKDGE